MHFFTYFDAEVTEIDQMIHAVLPEDALDGAPTSFNSVGHVGEPILFLAQFMHKRLLAQINLRDEYLPYKHMIGQIILDVSFVI